MSSATARTSPGSMVESDEMISTNPLRDTQNASLFSMLPTIPISVRMAAKAYLTTSKRSDFDEVRDLIRSFVSESNQEFVNEYLRKLLMLSTPDPEQLALYRSGIDRSLDTLLVNAIVARNMVHILITNLSARLVSLCSKATAAHDSVIVGLEILRNLSRSDRCQSAISSNSSLMSWILKIGRDSKLDERAQYLVFGILNNVVSDPDLATRLFAQHRNVGEILLLCVADDQRNAQNREWAMAAISNLANAGPIRVPLASTPGLVQALIDNCARAPSSQMTEWALLALWGLSAADANHLSLSSDGRLIGLLSNVVDKNSIFTDSSRDLGLLCLTNLCRSDAARRACLTNRNLVSRLTEVVSADDEDDDVREGSIRALNLLAVSSDAAALLANDRLFVISLLGMWQGVLPADSSLEASVGALLEAIGWPAHRVAFAHSAIVLIAVRACPRISTLSALRVLPQEIIRRVVEATGW